MANEVFGSDVCPAGPLGLYNTDDCNLDNVTGKAYAPLFQKTGTPFVAGENPIESETSWDGLTASVGDDSVTATQAVSEMVITPGGPIETTENTDGGTERDGYLPATVTITYKNPTPKQVKTLNGLKKHDNGTLGVYIIWSGNKIQGNEVVESPAEIESIPISKGTFSGDEVGRGGSASDQTMYIITFQLVPGYYENSIFVKADAGFRYDSIKGTTF